MVVQTAVLFLNSRILSGFRGALVSIVRVLVSDAAPGASDQSFPYLVPCFRHLGFQEFCIISDSVIIFMCFGDSFHKRGFG